VDREKENVADAEKEGNAAKIEAAKKKLTDLEERYKKPLPWLKGPRSWIITRRTGYLMIDEASPGNYVRLKRNPNWCSPSSSQTGYAYTDGLQVTVIPDPSVRWLTCGPESLII